jgi:putative oxidoreductase
MKGEFVEHQRGQVLERKIAMIVTMSVALLILRLVAGLTLAAHGAQKLFGWFGGGLSLAFGFLTPLGAAGALGAMFMAIVKAHWKNGFWNSKRGLEFPLQLLAAAVAIGFAGPGSYSLDALFGIALPTPLLFLILALVALLVDIIGLVISRIPLIRAEVGSHTS